VLGWELAAGPGDGIVPPPGDDTGFGIRFLPARRPKAGQNRLHFDLAPPAGGDEEAEVGRLIALGATRADIGQGDDVTWVVLADPDGNEFCVLAPRQRGGRTRSEAANAL